MRYAWLKGKSLNFFCFSAPYLAFLLSERIKEIYHVFSDGNFNFWPEVPGSESFTIGKLP